VFRKRIKCMKGLSLFAGAGIAETYLRESGVEIIVANELVPRRAELYQKIYPDCAMICGDITKTNNFLHKWIYNEISHTR